MPLLQQAREGGAARAARAIGILCLAAPNVASASSESPAYDVYVSSERDVVEEVATIRRVSRDAIEQKSARTLDETLEREPSIVVRRGGEGVARIDMRGLRTRQILLLVDGVPFRSTEDGHFDPSLIPSQIIERVDVTYGNGSVLYGDGALAGVLQVRTRSGEAGVQSSARGDFREGNQYLGEASVAGANGVFEGFAAGSYLSSDGYALPRGFAGTGLENGGIRQNADREQGNAFVKLGYAPGKVGRVDWLFDYRRASFGVPWSVVDDPDDPFAQNARFERVDDVSGFSTQLSGQAQPREDLGLRSWAYLSGQTEQRSRYDDESLDSMLTRNTFELEGTTLVSGGALHGRYDAGRLGALRFASNGRYERFDSEGRIRDVPTGGGGGGGGGGGAFLFRDVDESHDLGAWSLGLEYEVRPLDRSGIVLGYGHAFLRAARGVSDDGSLFLGGAYYDLPTGTRIRGSAAHKIRFPSIRQLYDPEAGNPELQPERCWCFELGVEQRLPFDTTIGVTGFWLELSGFIERLGSGDPFENRQELRNRGIEVTTTSRPWHPLALRLAYAFLDARDVSDGSPFDRLDNRPRHKLDAVAVYTLPWHASFRAAVTYAADTLIYARNDATITSQLRDFVLLDLKLEQRLWEDRIRVYAGVENLLDQAWTFNYGFPQAGRTVFGGLELRY